MVTAVTVYEASNGRRYATREEAERAEAMAALLLELEMTESVLADREEIESVLDALYARYHVYLVEKEKQT